MTPYDVFMKQASIPGLLAGANMVTAMPYMAQGVGKGLAWLGRRGVPGLARAGKAVETAGNVGAHHVERALNAGPGFNYSLRNLPGIIRKPLGFVGMETQKTLRMTPQRAAVWAGGGVALKQTFSPPPSPPQSYQGYSGYSPY